eukprot:TRINITY_DN3536_c0_g3_i1.p1 TRINITY_DN3536_c0_g3~~TRINITY_DN3536_c0_g3_i1.p1  ORF type:complete len:530 (+),score=58.39 TRINITY_DN3536_c0_g3_i1:96-1592(+)
MWIGRNDVDLPFAELIGKRIRVQTGEGQSVVGVISDGCPEQDMYYLELEDVDDVTLVELKKRDWWLWEDSNIDKEECTGLDSSDAEDEANSKAGSNEQLQNKNERVQLEDNQDGLEIVQQREEEGEEGNSRNASPYRNLEEQRLQLPQHCQVKEELAEASAIVGGTAFDRQCSFQQSMSQVLPLTQGLLHTRQQIESLIVSYRNLAESSRVVQLQGQFNDILHTQGNTLQHAGNQDAFGLSDFSFSLGDNNRIVAKNSNHSGESLSRDRSSRSRYDFFQDYPSKRRLIAGNKQEYNGNSMFGGSNNNVPNNNNGGSRWDSFRLLSTLTEVLGMSSHSNQFTQYEGSQEAPSGTHQPGDSLLGNSLLPFLSPLSQNQALGSRTESSSDRLEQLDFIVNQLKEASSNKLNGECLSLIHKLEQECVALLGTCEQLEGNCRILEQRMKDMQSKHKQDLERLENRLKHYRNCLACVQQEQVTTSNAIAEVEWCIKELRKIYPS